MLVSVKSKFIDAFMNLTEKRTILKFPFIAKSHLSITETQTQSIQKELNFFFFSSRFLSTLPVVSRQEGKRDTYQIYLNRKYSVFQTILAATSSSDSQEKILLMSMHLWDAAAFKLHKYVCTWRILQNATAALQWQGSKTVFGN